MDPEQRLFVVHEYLAVEVDIFFFGTLARILAPQRMDIIDGHRTFYDLYFFLWLSLFGFLPAVIGRGAPGGIVVIGRRFLDVLDHCIRIEQVFLVDRLIFRFSICLGQENLYRHEGAVFLQDLSCTVFICKGKAVFVQEQSDLSTHGRLAAVLHLILCTALACPVYRDCAFFIGKSIDLHLVCDHKCGIKSKTEMSDHIVLCGLVFIFFEELGRA